MNDRLEQRLTGTEIEVVDLVCEGLTNREVGLRLHVAESTVRWHLKNVFRKLGVTTRSELTRRWVLRERQADTPHL